MTAANHRVPVRFQFSLRIMIVIVLVAGAFFAGRQSLQPEVERARRDVDNARKAVEAARRMAQVEAVASIGADRALQRRLERAEERAEEATNHALQRGRRFLQISVPTKDPYAVERGMKAREVEHGRRFDQPLRLDGVD